MNFSLHPQLAADTINVGHLSLSQVLLMNDARFPWIILVPQRENVSEIIDLTPDDQATLFQEMAAASHALRTEFNPDKLNIGSLGNIVPQLHVHVVARFAQDPAWPGPVWGAGQAKTYKESEATARSASIAKALNIAA